MTRKKVKSDFIENIIARKASYQKRQKGFLNKAHKLNTLYGVELTIVVYSPYQERNTNQRISKIEDKLQKVREENKIMELTNQMYKLLNGEHIPTNMHLHDLNDLSYVINQHLKQVHDMIKTKAQEEGSTSNDPQSTARPLVLGGNNFDKPRASLLASVGALVSVVPLVAPSTILGGTNFESSVMAPLLVTDVTSIPMVPSATPLMAFSNAPAQVPQLKFPVVFPLRTPPQMVPFENLLQVPSSSSS
ncbi:hypothetical protein H5410_012590 [Solanum commersonii]|uniref:MADS-box domain-containing protein n=1 Tax=Solanum commersonii TaxID=4109 RepID=A0A9J6ASL7_SOLCO|nr:hypothetical protein H5410_012590 [Solanum commersonii]